MGNATFEYAYVAELIWNNAGQDAQWDPYDRVDAYDIECNVSLEIAGYKFEGWGVISCGEKIPQKIECAMPNGETIRII